MINLKTKEKIMSKKIKKILTGAAGIVSFAGVASGVAVTQNAENPVVYKSFEQKITGQIFLTRSKFYINLIESRKI